MTRSYTPRQIADGLLAADFTRDSAFVPLAEVERLTRQSDEARYFLAIFVHAHASNNAVPPHIEEQARKALAAKP